MHAKVREAQEAAEIKLREAVRRAKAEVRSESFFEGIVLLNSFLFLTVFQTEEEMQDKLKVSERRYSSIDTTLRLTLTCHVTDFAGLRMKLMSSNPN